MDKYGIASSASVMGLLKAKNSKITCALVLVGIDLIIFIVAYMVLYFGFVTKAVLITHQCFRYC